MKKPHLRDHRAPLRLIPRLDEKPWGGDRLADYGFRAPTGVEPLGEVLITHGDSLVDLGQGPTTRLADLAAAEPERLVGPLGTEATGSPTLFPLLTKLIDGMDDLSIQVHPDDALAREQGEPTGKTEAWHVLDAEPGAVLYLGLADGVAASEFFAACRAGDPAAAGMLRAVPATPGTTVVLSAGTVHALGRGVLVYETQQPSNTTYRLYDWGRVGPDGRPRDLHHDLGERATKPSLRPVALTPVRLAGEGVERDLLAATRAFALERIKLGSGSTLLTSAVASPQVLTCVEGSATVAGVGQDRSLSCGASVVIPVGASFTASAESGAVLLRSWVPDLLTDVVAPAKAAGASEASIAGLAGETHDLDSLLASR